jgi:hypothetical protein
MIESAAALSDGVSEIASDPAVYRTEIVEHIDLAWDALAANFSDLCLEQSAAYMLSRWSSSRLCGFVLRGALTGEAEAAALVVLAAIPLVNKGLAYVKFGPLWRRRGRPARPSVLGAALAAMRGEFSGLRGLVTRVMPPAEPEWAAQWKTSLASANFHQFDGIEHPKRYLVDLRLTQSEQLASLGAKWRANLRRVGASVAVREADPQSELPAFLRLYDSMRERKDFVDHHQSQHLSRCIAAVGPAVRPRLFLAYDGERAVAGSIVVEAGERAFVPFSASGAEALPLRAGYALRWGIIDRLRPSPARWLDLGGDEGQDGLRHFKEGNVGRRGATPEIPGEYDCVGSRLSAVTATALGFAHNLSRRAPFTRLKR